MNEPELTMPDAPTRHSLIAHDTALAAAGTAIRLVRRVPAPLNPDYSWGFRREAAEVYASLVN